MIALLPEHNHIVPMEEQMKTLRELVPGGTYYIMVQSTSKEFLREQEYCRKVFLELLFDLQAEYGFSIERFALYKEKVHFIITTVDNELPELMRRLLMNCTIQINKKFGRTGHLWDRRYYSKVLRSKEEKAIWSGQLTQYIRTAQLAS